MKTFFVVAILLCSMTSFSQKTIPFDTIKSNYHPLFYTFDKYGNRIFDNGDRKIVLLPFDNSLKNVFFLLHIKFVYLIDGYELMPSGKKIKNYK